LLTWLSWDPQLVHVFFKDKEKLKKKKKKREIAFNNLYVTIKRIVAQIKT